MRFFLGANVKGEVVLFVQRAGDERPVPVSESAGTWDYWIDALDSAGLPMGQFVPVSIEKAL
jgi:hypothetical protein